MVQVPTLFIDPLRCKKNIEKMAEKAARNKVEFRPHFKTHQSLEIGRWFKEFDVKKATVSSLKMASYFAQEWDDITVAFPANILEIDTINELASKIQLNLCVENLEVLLFLEKHLKSSLGVFLKVDIGYNRTGIKTSSIPLIDTLLSKIKENPKITFKGFLGHAGHAYNCRSKEAIEAVHQKSIDKIIALKKQYKPQHPDLIISIGDTPTCSVSENFNDIDEIRPGNFVYYDLTQNIIGSNEINEIAVAMACPIVSKHEDRNEIVIYGGGIHFSKDRVEDPNDGVIFGRIAESKGTLWGDPIDKMFLKSLSQEHGIVSVPKEKMKSFEIGSLLWVLPVHSCMTADLMKKIHTPNGGVINMM
ncbi:alanine racemase [Flavobacteriaceae bacterium]|nr:alanine racemase [Flavobacteriaceae bacterium]